MMTGIGQVTGVNVHEMKLSLKVLQQAGAADFSFGDADAAGENGEGYFEADYTFEEVVGSSWRIVTIAS